MLKKLLFVFPNFWGVFPMYLFFRFFIDHPRWIALITVQIWVVIYEYLHVLDCGRNFDWNETIAQHFYVDCWII